MGWLISSTVEAIAEVTDFHIRKKFKRVKKKGLVNASNLRTVKKKASFEASLK